MRRIRQFVPHWSGDCTAERATDRAVKQARREERERCAKKAEGYKTLIAYDIAAAIRALEDEK